MNNFYLYFLSPAGIEVLSGGYSSSDELEKQMRLEDHRRLTARATAPVPGTLFGVDVEQEAYYQLNSEGLMINVGTERGRDMLKQTLLTVMPVVESFLFEKRLDTDALHDAVEEAIKSNFNFREVSETIRRRVEDAIEELQSSLNDIEDEVPSDYLASDIAIEVVREMENL